MPRITREMCSHWFASASLLVNAALLVFYIPVPIYYLEHKVMLPLNLPPLLPPYASILISSVAFIATVILSCGKTITWKHILVVLVLAWALPEVYQYLAPSLLLLATLYLYMNRIGYLWRSLLTLASVLSSVILSLSLLSFLSPLFPSPSLPTFSAFFKYAIGLNLFPTALYPPLTLTYFVMAPLSVLYLIVKRPPIPSASRNPTRSSLFPLLLILLLSTALSLIPHLPQVNPSWKMIGVDSPHYVQYAEAVASRTIGNNPVGSLYPLNTERPLTILLIYALSLAVGVEPAVKIFPVLLSTLFTASSFLLARSVFRDERASILSAFFAATSFNLTAGYYSAILANWLSLSFAFLYFSLWIGEDKSLKRSVYSFILLTLCWLSHAWTWDFVLLISAAYIAVMAILERQTLRLSFLASKKYHILPLVASFALDRLKVALVGTGGAIEAGTSVSVHYLGAEYLLSSFKNLVFSFQFYVGGFYSNLLVTLLILVGVFLILRGVDRRKLLLLCWVSVLAVPFLIIDLELIWRILFLLPAPLICGYTLSRSNTKLFYILAFLWQINYVVYCLTGLF
ncbi:MAG: hypothetical protein H5T34_06630 [Candidatus Methanomethyliales bacterium]|nr:hypothetical protein [Candidatus Methanomethylicales archaeon]